MYSPDQTLCKNTEVSLIFGIKLERSWNRMGIDEEAKGAETTKCGYK